MISFSKCKKIVFLTGAGISQESGIKTFRDHNGLWKEYSIETLASYDGYINNPKIVHEFYNLRREQLKVVEPNNAHLALAQLQQEFSGKVSIITQNVDDLHERAASSNIIHMHGELRKIRNTYTNEVKYFEDSIEKDYELWRPHIVWFGEEIFYANQIYKLLDECDLFVAIGTSATVYPAAQFSKICHAPTVELNISSSGGSFDLVIEGKACEVVPKFIEKFI